MHINNSAHLDTKANINIANAVNKVPPAKRIIFLSPSTGPVNSLAINPIAHITTNAIESTVKNTPYSSNMIIILNC